MKHGKVAKLIIRTKILTKSGLRTFIFNAIIEPIDVEELVTEELEENYCFDSETEQSVEESENEPLEVTDEEE